MNRLERMSAILVKLQSAPVVTAQEIAGQFGVSLRTVYRDIRSLEESGVPICAEAGTGYSLVDGFKLPPLMFTAEEAISFLMAEKLVLYQTDADTSVVFRNGMDKIRAVLKTVDKDCLFDLDQYIRVPTIHNAPPPVPSNVLQPVLRSILEQRQVGIVYTAGYSHQTTIRTVEPQGIFFMGGKWYILAWCTLRSDYRTFHLGRVSRIEILDTRFSKKHSPLDQLIKRIYYSEPETEVILRTHRDAVCDMGMSKYSFGFYHEEADGEYFSQVFRVDSLSQFAKWLVSFVDQVEIISPAGLVDEVKKRITVLTRSIK
ncbi:MAG: YafY family transcriptional regulator [Bacteroidales bacterium]|jgi:predicted DNA-binding transcriptional regulator YafY|nr:YafY family transcriptional regulator [Bacteroidales bacterium]